MKLDDFAGTTPVFRPETFFDGRLRAWGLFQDRFGTVRRQFTVDIQGSFDGHELVLVEDFLYDDGEIDQRIWRIQRTGEASYAGRADDVVGPAEGEVAGRAMRWRYQLDLPVGERIWRVTFDDWMFLQDDDTLINRATMSKLGVTLGEVLIFFRRMPDGEGSADGEAAAQEAEQRTQQG